MLKTFPAKRVKEDMSVGTHVFVFGYVPGSLTLVIANHEFCNEFVITYA